MLSRYPAMRSSSVGRTKVPRTVPGLNTSTLAGGRVPGSGNHSTSTCPPGPPAAVAVPVAQVRSPTDTAIAPGSSTVAVTVSPS